MLYCGLKACVGCGLAALVVGGLAGCQAPVTPVGGTGIGATYSLGTLKAEISPRVDVLTATAAAEIALRDRGYVISSRSENGDTGKLRGKRANSWDWEGVQVEVYNTAGGTGFAVWVQPVGDEVTSRVVMEAILARLGKGAQPVVRPEEPKAEASAALPETGAADQQ